MAMHGEVEDHGVGHAPMVLDERVRYSPQGHDSDSSEEGINFWDGPASQESEGIGQAGGTLGSYKYIDDTTVFETVPLRSAIRHISSGPTIETLVPGGLRRALDAIAERAAGIGMRVNMGKMQLLCVAPRNGCVTRAGIATDNGTVMSGDTMKLVGFTSAPTHL